MDRYIPMNHLCCLLIIFSLCCLNSIVVAGTPSAPIPIKNSAAPNMSPRLWNLQDADILSVINEVSLETGKNFMVDPRVMGKISLISSKPIQPDQVYDLFLSVLELLGYSAIPSGDVIKIVPNMQSGELATRVATNQTPGKGDEVVVRVIPVENMSVNQLVPIIRPLLPQWSNVSTYTPGNVIIVLGRAANIDRINEIIHNVDKASSNDIDIIPLHRASASQVATVLTNLQNSGRALGDTPQISIAPDERTNSILLSGNKAARLHMHNLVTQLDTPGKGVQGNTQVIYLRYLQAKTFAPLLGKIAQNIIGNQMEGIAPISTSPNFNPPSSLNPITGRPNPVTRGASTTVTPENKTTIQGEPTTNALIITAPPTLMTALDTVISRLDIRPAQVLIDAIIVELDQNDTKNLGIQWGGLSTTASVADTPPNTGFATIGQGVVGIIPHMQFEAILTALQTTTGADILSTPSVVVLDNHRATLAVGQQVPDQTGQYATTGLSSTVTPFNTINRLDVQLNLDVTPQINLGDAVRLTIKLKNDSLQNPDNPTLNPTTNTSSIQNSVIVNSTDVLVLGGLMSNNISNSVEKVPILGDVPLIGQLFQHKTRRLEKKKLMVFIKPTILRSPEDAMGITNTKYALMRNAQINWPENITNIGGQKTENILPLLKSANLPKPFED
ncbi:MAG: gspD [Gammaproteobacteria bacterium]|jgi:general secretion pathway protein D|nr:gspD [Gammaproteobacteria bacterium]